MTTVLETVVFPTTPISYSDLSQLPTKDSNLDHQTQTLTCYRYTNGDQVDVVTGISPASLALQASA